MRIQSIVNTNDAVEIAYLDEADLDIDAGVMESRVVRIAHEIIDQELLDELEVVATQLLDVARRVRHKVADSFKAAGR